MHLAKRLAGDDRRAVWGKRTRRELVVGGEPGEGLPGVLKLPEREAAVSRHANKAPSIRRQASSVIAPK
jgi:hypothetical protein